MTDIRHVVTIPSRDGFGLAGDVFVANPGRVVVISSATAVPRRFYGPFAAFLQQSGFTVVTYDYRGVGESQRGPLRGFDASAADWVMDMEAVVDWSHRQHSPEALFLVGHSFGGQVAGLLANRDLVDAMVTFSAQSGHWRLQGGMQRWWVMVNVWLVFPALSNLFGYFPWSRFGSAEDLPKRVALQWAGWCRDRDYLLGDPTLPVERFASFEAPVLAYSFADDDWGTARSVDAMMGAYPNVERRHVSPGDVGMERIGHFGAFRPAARRLWDEVVAWFDGK